jgi:hypothetical protein
MTHSDETATVDYEAVVRGTREAVTQSIPADATLLVVSRGDEQLLEMEGRIAWHFPRGADGQYVGYHPADSAAALAHLDEWRTRGAQYLVLPATLFWWLDYYEDFAQSLRAGHGVAFEDESCIIFRLGGAGLSAPGLQAAALQAAERISRPLAELVDRLLPPDASVAVVSSGDERLVRLSGRTVAHFPPTQSETLSGQRDSSEELAALEQMRHDGVEYLVVPDMAPSWLDLHPDFIAEVERRYPCVASHNDVCSVFALSGGAAQSTGAAGDNAPSTQQHGWAARFAHWFRRS